MSRVLRLELRLDGAAFSNKPSDVGSLLRAFGTGAIDYRITAEGADIVDSGGSVCGFAVIGDDEPRRVPMMRGHTLLIGGEMVTLWPVEIAGKGTYPLKDETRPLVYFNHTESDMSEPCSVVEFCAVNRWGWAFASCDVSEAIKAADGWIDLKRRDREALRDCGSANSDIWKARQ